MRMRGGTRKMGIGNNKRVIVVKSTPFSAAKLDLRPSASTLPCESVTGMPGLISGLEQWVISIGCHSFVLHTSASCNN